MSYRCHPGISLNASRRITATACCRRTSRPVWRSSRLQPLAGALRRPRRPHHRHAHLRCLRAPQGVATGIRIHRRKYRCGCQSTAAQEVGHIRVMPEMPSTHAKIDRLPTDEDLGTAAVHNAVVLSARYKPGQRPGSRQNGVQCPGKHRGNRHGAGALSVIVERGVIIREFAAKIARKRLQYLMECPQGPEPDASGYKGFFYHFWTLKRVGGSGNASC